MPTLNDSSVRRRPDGSIDVELYVGVAHRARASEARALLSALCAPLRKPVLRPDQSWPAMARRLR